MGPTRPRDELTGRVLGDFVVREIIGQGGFGAVYRAEQPLLGREAVVKVLHVARRESGVDTERFLREARLASRVDHPYAAHIYAFGAEPDGVLWIAMELVQGTPLDRLLRERGPMPLEDLVPFLERLCEVVQTAHERGIVHRDIKPSNVMVLARAGRLLPKLLDLGIAKLYRDRPASPARSVVEAGENIAGTASLAGERSPIPAAPPPADTLTADGDILGSPPYMAPELWVSSAAADARADIYALGVLAYEALTGCRPFERATLAEVAEAHAAADAPAIGEGLPAALDAVLRRAMAKRRSERYDSPLAFAASFRIAAGLAPPPEALPELPESLRDLWLNGGPQPLAEAVAALDAARNAHQARDAIEDLVRAAARYVAIVAMACRTRMGPDGGRDATAVMDSLRALHRRDPDDDEWLRLARELVRPFAERPQSHPIPELVALFFPEDPFDTLLALRTPTLEAAGRGADEQVRDLLPRWVPALARLLRALGFLLDYRLGVPRVQRLELWMGVRRPRRPSVALPVDVAERQPILCDREGRPVASLWPLAQVAPPASGAAEELFLLAGKGRRGARLVAFPQGFEREDEGLWEWLGNHLPAVPEGPSVPVEESGPYRGLAAFRPEDATLFFGRERRVEMFVNRLRVQPLLAVVGPSGAGKTSFVQAGVIPALPAGWRAISVRPGRAPFAALEARLAQDGIEAHDPERLGRALADAGRARGTLVLIVDQLEEVFTLCRDPAERDRFVASLGEAARTAEDPVRIVLTLRDDFLVRAESLPALRERLGQALELLTTPDEEDLLRLLVLPARRAGFEFEDPDLPAEMVRSVAGLPGALALLSFTAEQLWQRRDRHFRRLTRRAYQSLGGVGGALAQHADACLAEMVPEEQRLTREVFRHLVTAAGTRAVLARDELLQLVGGSHAERVAERLLGARLLVSYEGHDGADRLEIVHEALIDAWPRLREWVREDAEGARLRDQLRAAARQWQERGRPRGLLWRDEALAELEAWRRRHGGSITAAEEAFAVASSALTARARRVRGLLAAVAFAALVAGMLVLWRTNQRTDAERARAETSAGEARTRLASLFEEQGRRELLAGHPPGALVFLAEARRLGANSAALDVLVGLAARPLAAERFALRGHQGRVWSVTFSPNGAQLVTTGDDGAAVLWEVGTGRALRRFAGHGGPVVAARFSPDGARLATASWDKTARLWDVATGASLAVLAHEDSVDNVEFSPDGRTLATVGTEPCARLWDGAAGTPRVVLRGHAARVRWVAFSPDGARLATASDDRNAAVWDLATGRRLRVLAGHAAPVRWVGFLPEGRRVLTVSADRTGLIWNADTGERLIELAGHADEIDFAAVRAHDGLIVTASKDQTARVWDGTTGALRFTLRGHDGHVGMVAWGADGARLVTASRDGAARLWDGEQGRLLASFPGHQGVVYQAALAPDGRSLATAGFDGAAKIWDAAVQNPVASVRLPARQWRAVFLAGGETIAAAGDDGLVHVWGDRSGSSFTAQLSQVVWVDASADGALLATAGKEPVARVWDTASQRLAATLVGHTAEIAEIRFDGDGRRVLTASDDGTVRVWEARTGRSVATLAHGVPVVSAAFSADGERVVAATATSLLVWRTGTWDRVLSVDAPGAKLNGLAVSPTEGKLATASQDGAIRVWELESGRLLAAMTGHASSAMMAAFSPDGALLLSTSTDRSAKLWDATGYRLLASFEGHAAPVMSGAFAPDGQRVVTAGSDGAVLVWRIGRDRSTAAELDAFMRCRVALTLHAGRLVPTEAACPP